MDSFMLVDSFMDNPMDNFGLSMSQEDFVDNFLWPRGPFLVNVHDRGQTIHPAPAETCCFALMLGNLT